jgi:hypothetical protein
MVLAFTPGGKIDISFFDKKLGSAQIVHIVDFD